MLVPDLQGHGVDVEQALIFYRGDDAQNIFAVVGGSFGFTKFLSFRMNQRKIAS